MEEAVLNRLVEVWAERKEVAALDWIPEVRVKLEAVAVEPRKRVRLAVLVVEPALSALWSGVLAAGLDSVEAPQGEELAESGSAEPAALLGAVLQRAVLNYCLLSGPARLGPFLCCSLMVMLLKEYLTHASCQLKHRFIQNIDPT